MIFCVVNQMHSSLQGKQVVVTRATTQAGTFFNLLETRGAWPLAYPCIQIAPPANPEALDDALLELANGAYSGLILTSVNTVFALEQRMTILGLDKTIFQNIWIAAIGPVTAEAAQDKLGQKVKIVPDEYVAERLADSIQPLPGERILLPRAEFARDILIKSLEQAGAQLNVVTAYRTQQASGGVHLPSLVENHQVDAITLTSSSIARYFVCRFTSEGGRLESLKTVCVACIGPVTAETAVTHGLDVQIVANPYTIPGLLNALESYFS